MTLTFNKYNVGSTGYLICPTVLVARSLFWVRGYIFCLHAIQYLNLYTMLVPIQKTMGKAFILACLTLSNHSMHRVNDRHGLKTRW